MKENELRNGMWVKFKQPLTESPGWRIGDVALVRKVNEPAGYVTLIDAADPKKLGRHGVAVVRWLEDKPVPNPFETGPGLATAKLPDARGLSGATEHDLLPDAG